MIGKWHLGYCKPEYLPTNRGFDSHYGYWGGAEDYYTKMVGPPGNQGYDFYDGEEVELSAAGIYSTDLYTAKANTIIQSHAAESADKPLFLYVAYQATHTPLAAPQRFQDMYPDIYDPDRMMFSAAASALDESVMNITQTLKDTGLYANTIIVFMGDNGALEHNHGGGSNYPLRGEKGKTWEGGVRTPAFILSPLLGATGISVDHLIHVTDWLPTFMKAAGASDEEIGAIALDGVEQWDLFKDPVNFVSDRDDVVLNIEETKGAYRRGDYKIVVQPESQSGQFKPFTIQNYSVESQLQTAHGGSPMYYLFNIVEDPEEMEDLSIALPDVLDEMVQAFLSLRDEMVPADDPEDSGGGLQDGVWVTGWC